MLDSCFRLGPRRGSLFACEGRARAAIVANRPLASVC